MGLRGLVVTIFPEYYRKYLKHWKNQPSDINIPTGKTNTRKKPSKISNKYSEMILTCISFIMEREPIY